MTNEADLNIALTDFAAFVERGEERPENFMNFCAIRYPNLFAKDAAGVRERCSDEAVIVSANGVGPTVDTGEKSRSMNMNSFAQDFYSRRNKEASK